MIRTLNPNNGEEMVPIVKNHCYVFVTDYRAKFFLKEIKVAPAQHTWEWISLDSNHIVDLSGIGNRYCSFDNAINKKVNDPYCTVYEFPTEEDMISCWNSNDIEYVDNIKTVYKSVKGEE